MFSNFDSQFSSSQSSNVKYQQNNVIGDRTLQLKLAHSKQSREEKRSRMRQINAITFLQYQKISFDKFLPTVEKQANPYTLLVTIFAIVDNYTWRQYLPHLELLIKKFTNYVQSSKGKVLNQICNRQKWAEKLGGYNFQERLQSMLHLADKQFQSHFLILIHALLAYNKRYCILDEVSLSDHLVYRHPYQKFILQDVIWLLTRMSLSCEAINKVIKNYLLNSQVTPLLPVLTIAANFIYQQPEAIVLQFISCPDFQNIIERGLFSNHFETQRQSIFICNNILFKSQQCYNFIVSQQNLISKIEKLTNQQASIFLTVIHNNKNKNQNQMEEQSTI